MAEKVNKNKVALALGLFLAFFHLVWSLFVAIMPGTLQSFMDWVFNLHHIKPFYVIMPFNPLNALMLIILTFVSGYIFGWVFATFLNWVMKK